MCTKLILFADLILAYFVGFTCLKHYEISLWVTAEHTLITFVFMHLLYLCFALKQSDSNTKISYSFGAVGHTSI